MLKLYGFANDNITPTRVDTPVFAQGRALCQSVLLVRCRFIAAAPLLISRFHGPHFPGREMAERVSICHCYQMLGAAPSSCWIAVIPPSDERHNCSAGNVQLPF